MEVSIYELLAAARESAKSDYIKGDSILCEKRFHPDTHYMVEMELLGNDNKLGEKGNYIRKFLTEPEYFPILFKALKVQERRANSYCQRVRPEVLEKIRKIPNKSITMDRVRNVWYGGRDGSHTHYDHTRYYALNLHAVFSKGTLEWRCFESTLHAGKVRANITLALAISAQAINQRSTQMKKTLISENPAFTFRTFLLRLGLIGDEYKNVRKHLLANLDGDLAWRYDKSTYECLKKNQRTEGVR